MIHRIYHGVDHEIFKPGGESKPPYFFHISSGRPKKNVNRVFAACGKLPEHNRPALVAVLSGPHSRPTVDGKGIKIIERKLPVIELAQLYRGALGFVFPSLHEGFGMPVLEAMASGCPVITSNVAACAEVAADAALLVNPRSVHDLACAMQRLVEDDSLRQALREKGLARAQQFSWRKSAEKHLEVFNDV